MINPLKGDFLQIAKKSCRARLLIPVAANSRSIIRLLSELAKAVNLKKGWLTIDEVEANLSMTPE
jgi:hypothetical protein